MRVNDQSDQFWLIGPWANLCKEFLFLIFIISKLFNLIFTNYLFIFIKIILQIYFFFLEILKLYFFKKFFNYYKPFIYLLLFINILKDSKKFSLFFPFKIVPPHSLHFPSIQTLNLLDGATCQNCWFPRGADWHKIQWEKVEFLWLSTLSLWSISDWLAHKFGHKWPFHIKSRPL